MIYWNVRPELVQLGPITIRWYGLLFATGFLVGHRIMAKLFLTDRVSLEYLDPLILYVALGTVAGARLGHCLFYEPGVYLADPIRILKVWEGGLASHGAAIGIILAIWLFCRKHRQFRMLWLLDRLSIPVIFAGGLIRIGNFFNSEIIGKPTRLPWGVVFARVDQIPRHPSQLYESIGYLTIFAILYRLFWVERVRKAPGLLFGIFLALVFGFRFLIEFLKEDQVAFEAHLPLDLGQLLSIPLVLIGLFLAWRAYRLIPAPGSARPARD